MRLVIALGGNALGGGETPRAERERRLAVTSVELADLICAGHEIVVTHGNGPQVGELMLDQESRSGDDERGERLPLDVLVAMTQAELGYRLQRALGRELAERGRPRPVVSLVTQLVVDRDDPAFGNPTKPVGPGYLHRPDDGRPYVRQNDRWRRVVASPEPRKVVERRALVAMLDAEVVPICAGGGGVPVAPDEAGRYWGVEAVVDKDLTSALVADSIGADGLLILTDVDRVARHHGTPQAEPLDTLTVDEADAMVADGDAASGSMGPKLRAASRVARGGGIAVITRLGTAVDALAGRSGTRIVT